MGTPGFLKAVAVVMVAPSMATASPAPTGPLAEAELRMLTQRFASAFAGGDTTFIDTLTHADFRMIGSAGTRIDRAAHLAAVSEAAGLTGVSHDVPHVRLFGTVALVHGVFEALGAEQRLLRMRHTEVFHWDGAAWRLVGAQHTPLREGVAKTALRGTVPPHVAWSGSDPAGDDMQVLHQLNERYVKAFRDADVGWYDAHLAEDYVVTNGDGSLSDRAAALAAFARPTFATQLRTFPVDQVHIRRFGDVALIEAENAFETRDGRRGISRYTDIWHKANGRWRCVSAHITVFKAPS